MKLTILDRKSLVKKLSNLKRITPKSTYAALQCTRVVAGSSSVKFYLTDLDSEFCLTETDVKIEEPGDIAIPLKTLYNVLNKYKSDEVSLSDRHWEAEAVSNGEKVKVKNSEATLTSGKQKVVIPSVHPDQYPILLLMDSHDESPSATLDGSCFYSLIKQSNPFVANGDQIREALNHVNIRSYPTNIMVEATDGHRLSSLSRSYSQLVLSGKEAFEGMSTEKGLLIHSSVTSFIEKTFHDCADVIVTKVSKEALILEQDCFAIKCKLSDSQYPDFRQIISPPQNLSVVNRDEFVSHLDMLKMFSGRSNLIVIDPQDGAIKVSANDFDSGSYEGLIETRSEEHTHEKSPMGFNAKYLEDIFKCVDFGESFEFGFTDVLAPAHFTSPEQPGDTFILMPMRIK